MSQKVSITLPKLGESIVSATIVQILKKEGDRVEKDEPLFEVSTDKVNSEIPSTVTGKVVKISVKEAEEVSVGDELAIILTDEKIVDEKIEENIEKKLKPSREKIEYFSPAVLKLAKENHIKMQELETIPGTGEGGRVTKNDVKKYINSKKGIASSSDTEQVITMSPMRKAIADNMVKSFYQAPHAYLFTEVDVTELLHFIEKNKREFLTKHQVKLSITSFLAISISQAAIEFPYVNASVQQDKILLKKNINLGLAVNIKEGLVVPVIKKCNKLSLLEIAKQIGEISTRAKKAELDLKEMQEGTITLTNFGMSGIITGLPIIPFPEVAIIGAGAIHKRFRAIDGKQTPSLRSVMMISLSFDHRAFDGIYACSFLNKVKDILEKKHLQE